MINKIILFLVLVILITACGKKGDPVYKNSKKINELQGIFITLT